MKVRQGTCSDTGRVRNHNEDSFFAQSPVFAVADGMGGHEAGEIASAVSLTVLEDVEPDLSAPANWLTETLKRANSAVYDAGTKAGGMLRMGTTLTAALVTDDSLWIGHVGDSRAYLLRGGELRQLTDDHSLVAEWVRDGRLTAEEAALHPQRSVITRALGIEPDVEVDVSRVTPARGDRILICSDGLTGELSDAEICDLLRTETDPEIAARGLVDLANGHGGEDNITVIVVDLLDDPAPGSGGDDPDETAVLTPVAPSDTPAGPGEHAPEQSTSEGPPGIVLRHVPSDGPDGLRADDGSGRRFWIRFTVWAGLTVVIVVGGWLGLNWYISNSWYVGVNEGNVTVYQGVPEGVLGLSTGRLVDRTAIPVSLLPATTRERVEAGIPADDRADAEDIVENLREQTTTTTTTTTTTRPPVTTAPPATLPPGPPPP